MAHAQKLDFVFRRTGRVHLNRRGRQFSWLLAAEVWASAVVMLDTPCSEVVWKVLATRYIRQFPITSPSVRHRVPSHLNWSQPPFVSKPHYSTQSLSPLSGLSPLRTLAVSTFNLCLWARTRWLNKRTTCPIGCYW